MILQDPTDFRGIRFSKNPSVLNDVNRYIVSDYGYVEDRQLVKLKPFSSDYLTLKPIILYGLTDSEREVPSFAHPLLNLKNNWIALDLRQTVSVDTQQMTTSVRNDSEYQFALQRFVLSGMWAVGKYEALYGFHFPHVVYGDWLSSNITKKFGLTMGDQIRLAVLSVIYYANQFTTAFGQEDLEKLKLRMKAEVYSDQLIDEVYQAAGKVDTLDDFCAACYKVTNNVRLKDFDFSTLVSVVNNNWFGLNASEMTLIALAHPPTWIAMVYSSLTQRSFRNSYAAKTVENRNKRGVGEEFLKELTFITTSYKAD